MEKTIKGWVLVRISVELSLALLILSAFIAAWAFGCYVLYLQGSWMIEHGEDQWKGIIALLASIVPAYWSYRILRIICKLIINFVFLIRYPHNDPKWLYDGLDR